MAHFATYKGSQDVTTTLGHAFKKGEEREVPEDIHDRLSTNRAFETRKDDEDPSELDRKALEAEADELGVEYKHNIGTEKLAERVAAARLEREKAESTEKDDDSDEG